MSSPAQERSSGVQLLSARPPLLLLLLLSLSGKKTKRSLRSMLCYVDTRINSSIGRWPLVLLLHL